MNDMDFSLALAEKVSKNGGTAYFVGGFVRDEILGIQSKDIDIEVHGIRPKDLEQILDSFGERQDIGKSFGIYGVSGYSVDIAMPRKESCRGLGHRDFDVVVDPFIGTKGASIRRDFTINALMKNILTGEIVDHFNGIRDLKNGIIRHVNDGSFGEDPLRVLRGAQFASRFGFVIADETIDICRKMNLQKLASERVFDETCKALTKSLRPSVFFERLREMNQLSVWFPELEALIKVEQNPKYHKEGNAWIHTMMVLDEASTLVSSGVIEQGLPFMFSALCHDFGKSIATDYVNGQLHSYSHETLGLPLVDRFLKRLTNEKKLRDYVLNMTELHMRPMKLAGVKSKIKKTNKLFDDSICPTDLIYLSYSDNKGRICEGKTSYEEEMDFLFDRLEIYKEYMSRPYVMGRDLIEAGLTPGENFSELLNYAHTLRLSGVDKECALKQTLKYAQRSD